MMMFRDNRKRSIAPTVACRRDKWARILLIALLAVILASGLFIVTHVQHDCVGPGCHTCAEISVCSLIIDGVAFAALLIFALGRTRRLPTATRVGLIAGPGIISKTRLFSGCVRLNC
ncbi:MAG: hypothetical protein LBL54_02930 [Clostridiales Family XIII bacterium]|jgi:hypothetical protein|nr:hypothetical protein [Clostridiales Family XIII bacterium]